MIALCHLVIFYALVLSASVIIGVGTNGNG